MPILLIFYKGGKNTGLTFYTHVSDQYAPFHTKVINATVRDATHMLDGLLYHQSDLRIAEHYNGHSGACMSIEIILSPRRFNQPRFSRRSPFCRVKCV